MEKKLQHSSSRDTKLEELLRILVAFPTVTSNEGVNHDAMAYVEQYLSHRGMHTRLFNWDHPALVATTRYHQKAPILMLVAHLDVVSAPPNFFLMRTEKDKLLGRGVWDMKFALAIYLQLVDKLKDHLQDYDFGIMVTTDEETGSHGLPNGVEKLIFHEEYSADCAVLPDGGQDWQIETFAKGHMRFTLTAKGKAAHGSRPWEGDNAIDRLVKALHAMNRDLRKQGAEDNTINLGTIKGGQTFNIVADHAEAEVEVRTMTNKAAIRITKEFQKICHIHRITMDTDPPVEPISHNLNNHYMQTFAKIIQNITKIKNKGSMSFGSTDARHFLRAGVPTIVVRPPGGGIHADNEWIDRQGLEQFEEVIHNFTQQISLRSTANIDPISHDKRLTQSL